MQRSFLRVDATWAIAYDSQQWLLQRFVGGALRWEVIPCTAYDIVALYGQLLQQGVDKTDALVAVNLLPVDPADFQRLQNDPYEGTEEVFRGTPETR